MKRRALLLLLLLPPSSYALSYDWKYSISGFVTRCFDAKDIKVDCEDFSDPKQRRTRVEELQIQAVDSMGKNFFYSYEKAIEGPLCQEHLRKIRVMLTGEKEVCITGRAEWLSKDDGTMNAKWEAFESRRGKVLR